MPTNKARAHGAGRLGRLWRVFRRGIIASMSRAKVSRCLGPGCNVWPWGGGCISTRIRHSLGIVGGAGQLPAVLLAPLAAVVDRWDRQRLLVVAQLLAMLQAWISLAGTGRDHHALAAALQCPARDGQCGRYPRPPGLGGGPRRPSRGSGQRPRPQRRADQWCPPPRPCHRRCRHCAPGGRDLFSPQRPQLSGGPGGAMHLPPRPAAPPCTPSWCRRTTPGAMPRSGLSSYC